MCACVRRIYFEKQTASESTRTSTKSNEGGSAVFIEDLFLQKEHGDDTLVVEVWDEDQCSRDDLLGKQEVNLAVQQSQAFNYFIDTNTARIGIEFQDKQAQSRKVVYLAFAYIPETSAGVSESSQQAASTPRPQSFEERHHFETEKQARAIESLRELQQNLFEEGVSWQEALELLKRVPQEELNNMWQQERSPEELLESSVREILCKKLQVAAENDGREHICICGTHEPIQARSAASLNSHIAPQPGLFKATFGHSVEAAQGLSRFVMLDDKDKSRSLARGCEALQAEFVKYGSIQDMENYFYIRYGQFHVTVPSRAPPSLSCPSFCSGSRR